MSKLQETNNFISLYLHACGDSEVPKQYHFWACISMIAALLGNRVGVQKMADKLLKPNLYTVLIGPPGIGKGEAFSVVHRFLKEVPSVNLFNGRVTGPRLLDKLAKPRRDPHGYEIIDQAVLYMTTEEMSLSFETGTRAEMLIRALTGLWAGQEAPFEDSSRQHKDVIIKDPCINWLAGSTITWFLDSVSNKDVRSGFFSRCIAIDAHYNFRKRMTQPVYPSDREEVMVFLRQAIQWFAYVEGQFKKTDEAKEEEDKWYQGRDDPESEDEAGDWRREHDILLKLAMVFSIATLYDKLEINKNHILLAKDQLGKIRDAKSVVRQMAARPTGKEDLDRVADYVFRAGKNGIPHQILLKRMGNYGMKSSELAECVETLQARRDISIYAVPSGGIVYKWISRKRRI